jgi:DNA-directed RNA polymerase specialized sigma24 family protein
MRECLLAILVTLPRTLEIPVRLHYLEEYRYAEIARTLGIPEGTVRSDAHSGLLKLRKYLQVQAFLAQQQDVQALLASLLSEHQLSVAHLHLCDNLNLEQIAREMHRELEQVKGDLYRGIEIVWKHIEQQRK